MLSLFSTLGGLLISGLPKVLDFFQNKADQKHERELASIQASKELEMAKQGFAAQARMEEIKLEQISLQTNAQMAQAEAEMKQLLAKRLATQPLNMPNAGFTFRNPPGDHAARLIEACGLKGKVIGGAQISEKHANFIVNLGNASARDIQQLIDLMRDSVQEKFGVQLQQEVKVLGQG